MTHQQLPIIHLMSDYKLIKPNSENQYYEKQVFSKILRTGSRTGTIVHSHAILEYTMLAYIYPRLSEIWLPPNVRVLS